MEDNNLKNTLAQLPDGVYAYGHNHMQMNLHIENKLLVNPGSCGVPLDFPNFAPYTILETSCNGYKINERRIPYDVENLIRDYEDSELYKEARVFCGLIAIHLTKGREYMSSFFEYVDNYANRVNDSKRPYSQQTWEKAYEMWCKEQD